MLSQHKEEGPQYAQEHYGIKHWPLYVSQAALEELVIKLIISWLFVSPTATKAAAESSSGQTLYVNLPLSLVLCTSPEGDEDPCVQSKCKAR